MLRALLITFPFPLEKVERKAKKGSLEPSLSTLSDSLALMSACFDCTRVLLVFASQNPSPQGKKRLYICYICMYICMFNARMVMPLFLSGMLK